jgi:hypothetical protein
MPKPRAIYDVGINGTWFYALDSYGIGVVTYDQKTGHAQLVT